MKIYIVLISVLLATSCVRNKNGQTIQMPASQEKVFEVSEVIQATGYSYLKVKENSEERWIAAARQEIAAGDVYYYDEALQMTNFHSKDLDRTFEVIYFVNQISKTPIRNHPAAHIHGMDEIAGGSHSAHTETKKKSSVRLEKTDGEITVADVFENKNDYSGKEVEIRGVVVKINKEIMGKNWVHIQDGTDSNGKFDLTITTQDVAEVNDEVIFRGKIILNKDFGSGYFYELLMEDAALTTNASAGLNR